MLVGVGFPNSRLHNWIISFIAILIVVVIIYLTTQLPVDTTQFMHSLYLMWWHADGCGRMDNRRSLHVVQHPVVQIFLLNIYFTNSYVHPSI